MAYKPGNYNSRPNNNSTQNYNSRPNNNSTQNYNPRPNNNPRQNSPGYVERSFEYHGHPIKMRAYPYTGANQNVKLSISITIGDLVAIKFVQYVCSATKGTYFIAFPQYRKQDGSYTNIAFPITSEFRELLNEIAYGMYEELYGS